MDVPVAEPCPTLNLPPLVSPIKPFASAPPPDRSRWTAGLNRPVPLNTFCIGWTVRAWDVGDARFLRGVRGRQSQCPPIKPITDGDWIRTAVGRIIRKSDGFHSRPR